MPASENYTNIIKSSYLAKLVRSCNFALKKLIWQQILVINAFFDYMTFDLRYYSSWWHFFDFVAGRHEIIWKRVVIIVCSDSSALLYTAMQQFDLWNLLKWNLQ